MDEDLPDFTGKTVAFYLKNQTDGPKWLSEGIALESPCLRKQYDRVFVVGKKEEPDDESERIWSSGREAALAWDAVLYYIVIPTDEYREFPSSDDDDEDSEDPNVPADVRARVDKVNKPIVTASFILIGTLLPLALLIAIIVWIIKTLTQ